MRFLPFRLKDYPHIEADLSAIAMDLAIARLGRNAIRLPGRVVFSANYAQGMKSIEVPLDKDGYEKAGLSLAEKMCLCRILDLLEKADEADLNRVETRRSSQYEVVRAIRDIDQNFGGKRFIDIAHDIIDSNMGACLYPYMAKDLVFSTYLAYNKNINRDVEGFMSAFVEFMCDFIESDWDLREVLAEIEEKSSAQLYLKFLESALRDEGLAPTVSDAVVELFTDPYKFRTNHAKSIPVSMLASFPKAALVSLFEGVHTRYEDTVVELLDYFGENCDPDYLYAYQRNSYYDASLLLKSPAFAKLNPDVVEEMQLRQWMVFQRHGIDIVRRFEQVNDLEAQKRFIKVAIDAGWEDIAHALNGESCSMRRFDYETFCALLPYFDLDIPRNRVQAIAFVRNVIDYNPAGSDKLLLSLRHPAFADVIREALSKQLIRDFTTQVILADRFHCPDAIQIKEWH